MEKDRINRNIIERNMKTRMLLKYLFIMNII